MFKMLRRTLTTLAALALATTLTLGQTTPKPQAASKPKAKAATSAPKKSTPKPTYANLVYGHIGGKPILLDLYLPKDVSKPVPCVVHIFGGGWRQGSKNGLQSYYFRLVELGFAVASVQYRLASQEGQWGNESVFFPAQIHDVKGAVRFLRAHAAEYHLDPKRFASWGESAGGHLSQLLALSGGVKELEGDIGGNLDQSSRVQACVDYYGACDLVKCIDDVTTPPGTNRRHDAPGDNKAWLIGWYKDGQGLEDVKRHAGDMAFPYPLLRERLYFGSPIHFVDPGDPPVFIGHGDQDHTVPHMQAYRLQRALKKAGVPVRLSISKGAGHGDLGYATNRAAIEFLCDQLNPAARPRVEAVMRRDAPRTAPAPQSTAAKKAAGKKKK